MKTLALILILLSTLSIGCAGGNDGPACPAILIHTVSGTITNPSGRAITVDSIELILDNPNSSSPVPACSQSSDGYTCSSGAGELSRLYVELNGMVWDWPVESVLSDSECHFPIPVILDLVIPPPGDNSCEFQGTIYEDGEEFSVDSCNSCKCNPSGTGPGAQLGVGCTAVACPQVCSGTLGICELNSDQSCPAEFPRENSECTIEESATCYKCGFSELDTLAESAYCDTGRWKFGDVACGS